MTAPARRRRQSTPEPGPVSLLKEILDGHIDRPSALCIGRHELMDKARYVEDADDRADHRHSRSLAAALCGACSHRHICPDQIGDPK